MRRLMVAVLVGLAAALILAACGQDQAPTPAPAPTAAPAPTPEPAPEPVVFDITTTDFQFDVTSLEVAVGQKVTLNLSNKSGRRSHNLNIHGYENLNEAIGANLKDGESKSVELTFDKPGYYPFFCPVGSHENGGMVGVLRVTGPSEGASTIKLQAPAADGNIRRGPRDVTVGVQVTNFELDAENVGGSTNKAGTGKIATHKTGTRSKRKSESSAPKWSGLATSISMRSRSWLSLRSATRFSPPSATI